MPIFAKTRPFKKDGGSDLTAVLNHLLKTIPQFPVKVPVVNEFNNSVLPSLPFG